MRKFMLSLVPALLALTTLSVMTGCSKSDSTEDIIINSKKATTGYQSMKIEYTIPEGVEMKETYCFTYFNTKVTKGQLMVDGVSASNVGTFFIPLDKEFNELWERYDAYYLNTDKIHSGMIISCKHQNSV